VVRSGVEVGTTDAAGLLVVQESDVYEVHAAGYVPELAGPGVGRTEWVELTPGVEVSGVVLDAATRAPVPGAFVTRREVGGDTWEAFATADEAGRFEIMVPRGQPFLLEVSADGVADVVERRVAEAPLRGLEVVVGVGGVLEGSVVESDGSPAGKVGLLLVPARRQPAPRGERTHFETDPAGRFRLRAVPLGVDLRVATFDDRNGWSEPVRFERDGELQRRNIRIPAPASLTLRVVGADAEETVLVEVDGDDERPGAATIDEDSWEPEPTFELPPGAYRVRVSASGWAWQERRVVLTEGESREEVFTFSGGETIEGTLLDVDGAPDVEAEVTCRGGGLEAKARTGPEGRFALRGLPRGPVTLVAEAYGSGRARAVWKGAAPTRTVLALPRAAVLSGRIAGGELGAPLRVDFESEHAWDGEEAFLLESGRFSVEISAVGEPVVVSLSVEDFAAPAVFALTLRPGEVRDLGEIRLDHGRAVRGRVVGPDGAPVPGARVAVVEPWSEATAVTDAQGSFSIVRMPRKPLWVRIDAEGFPSHIQRVEDGSVVTLTAGGVVTGRGRVTCTPVGDEWLDREDAATVIDAFPATLQAGTYRATWEDGHAAEFVVRDGETTQVANEPR
jgi:hypothetical protein